MGSSERDIIRSMGTRLYENEQGVYISNGLSTEMICFPSDRLREDVLNNKIDNAISYATTMCDIPELNALQYLPKPKEAPKADKPPKPENPPASENPPEAKAKPP